MGSEKLFYVICCRHTLIRHVTYEKPNLIIEIFSKKIIVDKLDCKINDLLNKF